VNQAPGLDASTQSGQETEWAYSTPPDPHVGPRMIA